MASNSVELQCFQPGSRVLFNTYHLLLEQEKIVLLHYHRIINSSEFFIVSGGVKVKIQVVLLLGFCLYFSVARSRSNNFRRTSCKNSLIVPSCNLQYLFSSV